VGDDRLVSLFAVEFEGALLLDDVVGLTLEFDVELGPN